MKPRRVAAPMLVAWLLLVPPLSQDRSGPDQSAALSQWSKAGTYDTADACKSALAKLTAVIAGNLTYTPIQKCALASKCIAADDPRIHSDNFEMR